MLLIYYFPRSIKNSAHRPYLPLYTDFSMDMKAENIHIVWYKDFFHFLAKFVKSRIHCCPSRWISLHLICNFLTSFLLKKFASQREREMSMRAIQKLFYMHSPGQRLMKKWGECFFKYTKKWKTARATPDQSRRQVLSEALNWGDSHDLWGEGSDTQCKHPKTQQQRGQHTNIKQLDRVLCKKLKSILYSIYMCLKISKFVL